MTIAAAEVFDPLTMKWTVSEPLPESRSEAAAVVIWGVTAVTKTWRRCGENVTTTSATKPTPHRVRVGVNEKPQIKNDLGSTKKETLMQLRRKQWWSLKSAFFKTFAWIIVFLKCKTHCKWFISRFIFLISHPRLEPPVILAKLETQPWVGDIFKSRWLAAVLNIQYLRLTDLSRRWGNSVFSQSRQQQTVAAMWWRRHFHDARLVNSTQSHLTGKSN